MKTIFNFIFSAMGIALIFVLHLAATYVLPVPFARINLVFVFLIICMLIQEKGTIVWVSYCLHLLLELYTTTPFGIILFAGTIATLLAFWFYRSIFTNRSFFAAMAIGAVSLFIYRSIYIGSLLIRQIFFDTMIFLTPLLWIFFLELIFTTGLIGFLYAILSKILKKFSPKIIYS